MAANAAITRGEGGKGPFVGVQLDEIGHLLARV